LQPGNKLATGGPTGSASYQYVTGSGRQSWSYQAGPTTGSPITTHDGPDQVIFSSDPIGPGGLAMHGPMTANLWIASTAPDTDLFVEVADDAPDGSRTFLQRGMLKASHRAIDKAHSDIWTDPDGTERIYRPYRPHINPVPITPGDVNEYLVEIFPVGHIFREGHKLTVIVHAPPLVDSYYSYAPTRAPAGVNTIYVDAEHPSRIMVPEVPMPTPRDPGFDPKCGQLEAVRCVPAP
jgi:predicted acyl esterase